MAPVETFVRQRIGQKLLEELEGAKVTGVLLWQKEEMPGTLEEKLRLILTRHSARDTFKSEKGQREWEQRRAADREKYGERALILLFPEKGHREFNAVIQALNWAEIYTVDQLLADPEEAFEIRGIDSSGTGKGARIEALQTIIDHFAPLLCDQG